MKARRVKLSYAGVDTSGREEGKQRSEGGQTWWSTFLYVYENRTIKPVEIVLRREEGP
jgi:hypothetical protein